MPLAQELPEERPGHPAPISKLLISAERDEKRPRSSRVVGQGAQPKAP